ncbi:MAG: ACP S-malonyltransferase [Planctomycetia bacterium]|nr:ACP S-malonyltransferase [Planctomycetia bacterium]
MTIRPEQFRGRLPATAFAFRGYNVTNLGRTPELLEHAAYGPIVETALREGSKLAADVLGRPIDLVERVRRRRETHDLGTYAEDVTLIVSASLAQLRVLDQCFGVPFSGAKLTFGHSLGEASALIATGMYRMEDLLRVLLSLTDDSVALAEDVTMGILFSRGPILDLGAVQRLCVEINQQGRGTMGVSSHLSPNCVLLLGAGDTLDQFRQHMPERLPPLVSLRKHGGRWPPLHTPITWQRYLPNRAAVLLQTAPGGLTAPTPPLLSGVTGKASFNDYNSRELLRRWVDETQQLWEQMVQTINAGVQTIVHVGPAPNLIPATFKRLADDIRGAQKGYSPSSLGLRAIAQVMRRPWLAQLLPAYAGLLRVPFIEHLVLEDWLLEQQVA